ncbi:MAG TPA: GNAT family N-acetyltransferase [Gemmatimonadaceae bacterium]|nr:GNAT family N-acetyltransferase [Gemmatimonadaceae bacterium]
MNIRRVTATDAEQITEIYNWHVLNTIVTFETTAVTPAEMRQRIQDTLANHDWIVGECNQQVIGYAYYGPFRARAAYSHTVESTIYLSSDVTGRGFGKSLYAALIASATSKDFREMIGVIALPNPASIALHQTLGFQDIGVLRGVGYKFGQYIDVGLWQRSSQLT